MKNALAAVALVLLAAAPATAKKPTAKEFMEKVYFAAVDSKQLDRLAEVDSADIEMVTPMGTFKGIKGHQQLTGGFAAAFPNFKHTVTRCIEQGETAACEGSFSGDHTGPMMMPNGQSVPPTQKHIDIPWGGLATIKGGKVSSIHVYFDTTLMMQQLGLIPPPAVAKR